MSRGWVEFTKQLRQCAVSRYLLTTYRPLAMLDGQVIYVDRSLSAADPHDGGVLGAKVTTDDLYFQPGHGCDWGSAPDFLAGGPGAGAPSVALTPPGRLETTAALVTPNGPWSEYGWLRVRLAPGHGAGTATIPDGPPGPPRRTV